MPPTAVTPAVGIPTGADVLSSGVGPADNRAPLTYSTLAWWAPQTREPRRQVELTRSDCSAPSPSGQLRSTTRANAIAQPRNGRSHWWERSLSSLASRPVRRFAAALQSPRMSTAVHQPRNAALPTALHAVSSSPHLPDCRCTGCVSTSRESEAEDRAGAGRFHLNRPPMGVGDLTDDK